MIFLCNNIFISFLQQFIIGQSISRDDRHENQQAQQQAGQSFHGENLLACACIFYSLKGSESPAITCFVFFRNSLSNQPISRPGKAGHPGRRSALSDDDIPINSTNFWDANFRQYVSDNFDKERDGFLSAAEISQVESITIDEESDPVSRLQAQ